MSTELTWVSKEIVAKNCVNRVHMVNEGKLDRVSANWVHSVTKGFFQVHSFNWASVG